MEGIHISLNNLINEDITKINEFLLANNNVIYNFNLDFLLIAQKFNKASIDIVKNILKKTQNMQTINDFYYVLLSFHFPEQVDSVLDYFLDFANYFSTKELSLIFKVLKKWNKEGVKEEKILESFVVTLKKKVESTDLYGDDNYILLLDKWITFMNALNLGFLRKKLHINEIIRLFVEDPLKLKVAGFNQQLDNYLARVFKFLSKFDEKQTDYYLINYILNQPPSYPMLSILNYLVMKRKIKMDYFPESLVRDLLVLDLNKDKRFIHLFMELRYKYETNLMLFNDFQVFKAMINANFDYMISILRKHPDYFYSVHGAKILQELTYYLTYKYYVDYEKFLKVYSEFRVPEVEEYIYQISNQIKDNYHFDAFINTLAHMASDGAISILLGYTLNPGYNQNQSQINNALQTIKRRITSN